jgi:hypothetical protein
MKSSDDPCSGHTILIDRHHMWLADMAHRVLGQCRTERVINIDGTARLLTLYVPSGDMKYKSFWVRDAAMMASCGLIPTDEIRGWLDLVAAAQNGPAPRILANGLQVPPWSIADHINDDGRPVFFPGTYSSGQDQGQGRFGFYPPHDDQYYFIDMAWQYYRHGGDADAFQNQVGGIRLLDRLEYAFRSYQIDPDSQLCFSTLPDVTVDWGFCDTIVKSGLLLYPSLLRYQAAMQLAEIFTAVGDPGKSAKYTSLSEQIRTGILRHLKEGSGWLLSATETGRQQDVWGTAFAVWTGVLQDDDRVAALRVLAEAFKNGTAVSNGYVRHILEGDDARSGSTAWEMAHCTYNTYQNGGYWATPTGWYLYALAQIDLTLAEQMLDSFINHSLAEKANGAPFEWISRDGSVVDGRLYGASAALPCAAVMRLSEENGNGNTTTG